MLFRNTFFFIVLLIPISSFSMSREQQERQLLLAESQAGATIQNINSGFHKSLYKLYQPFPNDPQKKQQRITFVQEQLANTIRVLDDLSGTIHQFSQDSVRFGRERTTITIPLGVDINRALAHISMQLQKASTDLAQLPEGLSFDEEYQQMQKIYERIGCVLKSKNMLLAILAGKQGMKIDGQLVSLFKTINHELQQPSWLDTTFVETEKKVQRIVGNVMRSVTQPLYTMQQVWAELSKKRNFSSSVVSILDPKIEPEHLAQYIEQNSLVRWALKWITPGSMVDVEKAMEKGVPASQIMIGARNFIDTYHLHGIMPLTLKTLRSSIGTYVINPLMCLSGFLIRPLSIPLRVFDEVAQDYQQLGTALPAYALLYPYAYSLGGVAEQILQAKHHFADADEELFWLQEQLGDALPQRMLTNEQAEHLHNVTQEKLTELTEEKRKNRQSDFQYQMFHLGEPNIFLSEEFLQQEQREAELRSIHQQACSWKQTDEDNEERRIVSVEQIINSRDYEPEITSLLRDLLLDRSEEFSFLYQKYNRHCDNKPELSREEVFDLWAKAIINQKNESVDEVNEKLSERRKKVWDQIQQDKQTLNSWITWLLKSKKYKEGLQQRINNNRRELNTLARMILCFRSILHNHHPPHDIEQGQEIQYHEQAYLLAQQLPGTYVQAHNVEQRYQTMWLAHNVDSLFRYALSKELRRDSNAASSSSISNKFEDIIPVVVPYQLGADCGYHAFNNAVWIANGLKKRNPSLFYDSGLASAEAWISGLKDHIVKKREKEGDETEAWLDRDEIQLLIDRNSMQPFPITLIDDIQRIEQGSNGLRIDMLNDLAHVQSALQDEDEYVHAFVLGDMNERNNRRSGHWFTLVIHKQGGKLKFYCANSLPSTNKRVSDITRTFIEMLGKHRFNIISEEDNALYVRLITSLNFSEIFERGTYALEGEGSDTTIKDTVPEDLVEEILDAAEQLWQRTNGNPFWCSSGYIEPFELITQTLNRIKQRDGEQLNMALRVGEVPVELIFHLTKEQKTRINELRRLIFCLINGW